MLPAGPRVATTLFLLVKTATAESLRVCFNTGTWGVAKREKGPQPAEELAAALHERRTVILIVSKVGAQQWYGHGRVTGPAVVVADHSFPFVFPVQWRHFRELPADHTRGGGLSFQETERLTFVAAPGGEPQLVNTARNMQAIGAEVGQELLQLIDDAIEYEAVRLDRERQEQLAIAADPTSHFFLSDATGAALADEFAARVGQLGRVELVYCGGSRLYNLQLETSDWDMFAVYTAPFDRLVGLAPSPKTIKNRSGFQPDFTVYEVGHYVELLLGSDPRMLECLFTDDRNIFLQSDFWRAVQSHRDAFFTVDAMAKYVTEIVGPTGWQRVALLAKARDDGTPLGRDLFKVWYIILRMTATVITAVRTGKVLAWLDGSARNFLLSVRAGIVPHEQLHALLAVNLKALGFDLVPVPSSENLPEGVPDCFLREPTVLPLDGVPPAVPSDVSHQIVAELRRLRFADIAEMHQGPSSSSRQNLPDVVRDLATIALTDGDELLLLSVPGKEGDLVGVFAENVNTYLLPGKLPEAKRSGTLSDGQRFTLHEISAVCQQLLRGNPNFVARLQPTAPALFKSTTWEAFVRSCGFVSNAATGKARTLLRNELSQLNRGRPLTHGAQVALFVLHCAAGKPVALWPEVSALTVEAGLQLKSEWSHDFNSEDIAAALVSVRRCLLQRVVL